MLATGTRSTCMMCTYVLGVHCVPVPKGAGSNLFFAHVTRVPVLQYPWAAPGWPFPPFGIVSLRAAGM